MLPTKRQVPLQVLAVGLVLLVRAGSATPQRFEDLVNQILPQAAGAGGGTDKNGNYNVFFIPAYRLAHNKTAAITASTTTPSPPRLDPRTSARLLTAALSAAARLTASPSPPPPSHTTPAPTLPPHAARLGQLVRREQPDDGGLPAQHHDAHILVTLQNYGLQAKPAQQAVQQAVQQPVQQTAQPPQSVVGYGHGYGSAHHFNNYPAVDGHVPAHYGNYGHLPYYGHFPVPVAPSAVTGPGAGLLYPALPAGQPRVSAAARALDLVSSSPIAATHALGTTGPLYASPGRPAGTLNSLGSLASAAASAPVEAPATTVEAAATTTVAPSEPTTMTPTTMSPEATESATNPKDDVEGAPRTTPFKQTFEFGRSDSSRRLNLTEEVEVTRSLESSADVTTPPPPTPATQQTSPATDAVTEIKDLNSPPPTGPAPTPAARDDAPAGRQPPPYPFHPPGAPGAYPAGVPLGGVLGGGYRPPEFRFRHDPYRPDLYRPDPYRDPRFEYQPQHPQQPQQPQQKPQQPAQQTPAQAVNRNPNYPGNFDPFFGAYVPGFAPGYPFGVPPQGANAQHTPGTPFGARPTLTGFGPPYGPFPATSEGGNAGGGGGGSAGGSGSQEAAEEPDERPARLQAGQGQSAGSAEDLGGRHPFALHPQQQLHQQRQQFPGFPGSLAQLQQQLPFSGSFQSTGPDGGAGFPASNSFYRPGVAASGQGGGVAGVTGQFQDDFLSRQRLLYPGPSGGARPQQQLRSPLFTPQLGLGSGGGGSLLSPQRPFSFNSPLFFPSGGDADAEPRQSQLKQYTSPDKLVSAGLDVSDLLGPEASLGTVRAPHTLDKRYDASSATAGAAKRVGFHSAANR